MKLPVRLQGKVAASVDGCWEWLLGTNSNGYGVFTLNYKQQRVHRYSYEFFFGPIPKGVMVLHSCDNRKCVNPDHLRLGTAADNANDRVSRDRSAKGEKHGMVKLSNAEVTKIRKLSSSGKTQRELAKKFNVTQTNIWHIVNFKSRKMP